MPELKQDRAQQEERDRLTQIEEDARRAQREVEAEEQHRDAEKKKPKLNSFDNNRAIVLRSYWTSVRLGREGLL
jgi:hypothetical protein